MASYAEQAMAKIEEFEGSIPWMYRDTVGRVTVGVGLMLPNPEAALRLPFQRESRAARAEEIAAEYARVDAMPMGRPALFYRAPGAPELNGEAVAGLLRTVLEEIDARLAERVKGFTAMPDGVKMALLDMAYNLGVEGLLRGYPRMIASVEAGEWAHAAAESFRHGPGAARNQWTRQMLSGTVVIQSLGAVAEGRLKRLGYGLVGMAASWLGR